MAELPASWDLKTERREDGNLNVVGTNNAGKEYVARRCDTPELRDADIAALDAGNPEKTTPREFVARITDANRRARDAQEKQMLSEFEELALPVARAGLHKRAVGWSRQYADRFDRTFAKGE